MKQRHQLSCLLLQIRDDRQTRQEELESFAAFSGLDRSQIQVLNVFDTAHFCPRLSLDGFDALLVGGSSDATVLEPERYPFIADSIALLQEALRRRLPTFCSCFGHQLAVLALGGEITTRQQGYEMGTLPIALTSAAADDLLFHDMPDPFLAVSVHRQQTTEVPAGCTLLAETAICCHSFRVDGAPFWTTQFHPEVSRRVLVERLTIYKASYTRDDSHLQHVLDQAQETPEANALLGKFIDRVVLGSRYPSPACD